MGLNLPNQNIYYNQYLYRYILYQKVITNIF